jgi:hypothetical protein
MTESTSFAVADREDTPVTHTFTPNGFDKNNPIAFFRNSGSTHIEDENLSISWRETATNRKVRLKLTLPTVVSETINGVTRSSLERVAIADVQFTFSSTSVEQERDNFVGLLVNALSASNTVLHNTVVKNEAIW